MASAAEFAQVKGNRMSVLQSQDPEVYQAIEADKRRLTQELVLIASENYASAAVQEASGSVMTNKYAEGYPGRRYYAGCENVDVVENLARDRAKQIFGCEHVNVQPHSGTQANMAAYFATLSPGDRVLGMRLDQGGHLSHGSPVNFSGKLFEFQSYGVDRESELIDYDEVLNTAKEFRPHLIVCGATAYPRLIDFERFRSIADEVDALLMADIAHTAGLVAGGAHPSPVPWAHLVTTTTHKTLRGPRGAMIMAKADLARKVDSAVFPNTQGGPLMHQVAAKAVAFKEALQPAFKTYAHAVVENAQALGRVLRTGGLRLVSGGTDNHLILVDVTPLGIDGQQAETALRAAGVIANKNAIPFDPKPPRVTSGIRLGTPALTSRGMAARDMETVGGFILEALRAWEQPSALSEIRKRVVAFASPFHAPGVTGS